VEGVEVPDGIDVVAIAVIDVLVSPVDVGCEAVMITVLWVGVTAFFCSAHMV